MRLTTKAEHVFGRMLFAAVCLAAGLTVWGSSASAQEVSASGAQCSAGAIAGDYSSGFGDIKCQVSGSGLSCCYGKSCGYSLSLTPTADGKVVGRWDHNNGDSGPVSFGLNESCDLTNGLYSRDPNPPSTKWSVGARTSGSTADPTTSSPSTSACTAADAAGDYSSSYGNIQCREGGSGLSCGYSSGHSIDLAIDAGLGKAVGQWDHNDGKRSGPVEFGISSDCHLATGWWSEDEGTAQKEWTIRGWSGNTGSEADSVAQTSTESAAPTPLIQKGDVDPATAIGNTKTILDGPTSTSSEDEAVNPTLQEAPAKPDPGDKLTVPDGLNPPPDITYGSEEEAIAAAEAAEARRAREAYQEELSRQQNELEQQRRDAAAAGEQEAIVKSSEPPEFGPGGNLVLSGVSGYSGGNRERLDHVDDFFTGITWSERDDRPCMLNAFLRGGYTPSDRGDLIFDKCISRTIFDSWPDAKTVGGLGPIRSLRVCNNNNRNHRLKGMQIWGAKIDDLGNRISQPESTYESRPNCDEWGSVVRCPSGTLATGLLIHSNDAGRAQQIVGLELICRAIVQTN